MNRIFISIVAVFVVVGGLAVFQATRQTASAVLLPSELVKVESQTKLARIRVGGRVIDPIEYRVEPDIFLKFNLKDPPSKDNSPASTVVVAVQYSGLRPDMFAAGRDVIIEGSFSNGTLLASKLLTQCPSKYEPPDPSKISEIQHKKDI